MLFFQLIFMGNISNQIWEELVADEKEEGERGE
jgi:hypothetical protein